MPTYIHFLFLQGVVGVMVGLVVLYIYFTWEAYERITSGFAGERKRRRKIVRSLVSAGSIRRYVA